ncbi:MAG: esterase family protein [Anaerolineae bacterium]|nr:esterase family protein [Anaerolineae bacterium]
MLKPLCLLISLGLVLALAGVSLGQEESITLRESFFSDTLHRDFRYNIILPAGYDQSGERYPVIYLLHGRGDTGTAWLRVHDTLDALIASGEIPPVIAVLPDMPSSSRASYYVDSQYTGTLYQAEQVETAVMQDLIPHIDATYRTRTERDGRFVGGYSMGAYGAIRWTMAYPQRFRGALVLSPAVYFPLPPRDSSTREFGAFGRGDVLFDEDIYQSLNYPALLASVQASDLPLSAFIAVGDDEWRNPNYEERMHDLDMEAHMFFNHVVRVPNITAELRVYDGGHDWDVWRPGFIEGMRFLLSSGNA